MTTFLRDTDFLEYRFAPSSAGALWLARQLLEQWLVERHVRCDRVGDLVLAATELCGAAARGRDRSDRVDLTVWIEGCDVVLQVEDGGPGRGVPADGHEAGGDLRLAAALTGELTLRVEEGCARARCRACDVVLPH